MLPGTGRRSRWPLTCQDREFESRRRYEYLAVVNVLCCQVEVSATGRSLAGGSPTEYVCVCECVCRNRLRRKQKDIKQEEADENGLRRKDVICVLNIYF